MGIVLSALSLIFYSTVFSATAVEEISQVIRSDEYIGTVTLFLTTRIDVVGQSLSLSGHLRLFVHQL
jgi:hypothetical protein